MGFSESLLLFQSQTYLQQTCSCSSVLTLLWWPSAEPSFLPGCMTSLPTVCPSRGCHPNALHRTFHRHLAPEGKPCKRAFTFVLEEFGLIQRSGLPFLSLGIHCNHLPEWVNECKRSWMICTQVFGLILAKHRRWNSLFYGMKLSPMPGASILPAIPASHMTAA